MIVFRKIVFVGSSQGIVNVDDEASLYLNKFLQVGFIIRYDRDKNDSVFLLSYAIVLIGIKDKIKKSKMKLSCCIGVPF